MTDLPPDIAEIEARHERSGKLRDTSVWHGHCAALLRSYRELQCELRLAECARDYGNDMLARARTEIERLKGVKPELPPRPPDGQGLPRYGLRWNFVGEPAAVSFDDGYWTPWHLAWAEIERLHALNTKLLAALQQIAVGRTPDDLAAGQHADIVTASRLCGIARAAISESEKQP